MTEIVTNIPYVLLVTLSNADGTAFNLASPAPTSVQATIISISRATVIIGPQTLTSGSPGADWANGVVAIPLSAGNTALLNSVAVAQCEVKATYADGSVKDWPKLTSPIIVTRGTIP